MMTRIPELSNKQLHELLQSKDRKIAALAVFLFNYAKDRKPLLDIARQILEDEESGEFDELVNFAIEEVFEETGDDNS
jgi:hypothetical protein